MVSLDALTVIQVLLVAVTSSSPVLRGYSLLPSQSGYRMQPRNTGVNFFPMTNENVQIRNSWLCACSGNNGEECACGSEDPMHSGMSPAQETHAPFQRMMESWQQEKQNGKDTLYGEKATSKRGLPPGNAVITEPCSQGIPRLASDNLLTIICEAKGYNSTLCASLVREMLPCQ